MPVDDQTRHVVIAGAGHAGGAAAAMLRQLGWPGAITLIGEEPVPPYQRPPLSKAWLKGEAAGEDLALRPATFYADASIDLRTNTCVVRVDRAAHTVASVGWRLAALRRADPRPGRACTSLAAARRGSGRSAGTAHRRGCGSAEGHPASGCQARRHRRRLYRAGGRGFCPRARSRGHHNRARRAGARPRCLPDAVRLLPRRFHRAHGVAIEVGAQVAALEGAGGHVTGVRLGDGRLIPCDAALVGVGAVANDELARQAGLDLRQRHRVDLAARTDDPDIFAIGDCTRRPLPLYERMWRLESVPNALEQAKQAASTICGKPPPTPEVTLVLVRPVRPAPADRWPALRRQRDRGARRRDAGKFALFHLTPDGTVQAVEAVNAPTEFMGGRRIIARRKRLDSRAN